MGKHNGTHKKLIKFCIATILDTPDPNGNRSQRRAAKKLKIKPEHVVKDDNVNS